MSIYNFKDKRVIQFILRIKNYIVILEDVYLLYQLNLNWIKNHDRYYILLSKLFTFYIKLNSHFY